MTKLPTMKRWTGLLATLSVVLAVSAALSISAFAQTQSAKQASESMVKIFAPNGTLRASINLGNPVLASVDPATDKAVGVSVDLAT